MSFQNLVRSNIQPLEPYKNTRSLYKGKIFLDDMESPFWGKYKLNFSVPLNRYPDGENLKIREKIAKYIGGNLKANNIIMGNGSDELINLLIYLFLEEDENILYCPPSFVMYKHLAQVRNCQIKEVALISGVFQLNVSGILKALDSKTKIIFLCNPNNPTGTLLKHSDIEEILQKAKCIVVVDEAYGEFFPNNHFSFSPEINKYDKLIVLRTFSKAWGLAGLRCGYAIASEKLIKELDKIRLPFNIDSLTAFIVDQVLNQKEIMLSVVKKLVKEREFVEKELNRFGLVTYSTITNFLCVKLPKRIDSKKTMKILAEQYGILVRDRSQEKHLENCLRLSVEDTRKKNQYFIKSLAKILNQ